MGARDKYRVRTPSKANAPGTWDSTLVEVFRQCDLGELERVCAYERDYVMFQTFEPFRQGKRELALISHHYTRTAVLDLVSGAVIAEETEGPQGGGFCPVGFLCAGLVGRARRFDHPGKRILGRPYGVARR